ncbi:hypothetical protein COO60DRAFT_1646501 [Scenedesmus sp. NREL 46B-D3]|nr:hypothetical protein COO60DRAFT_1646501 [Scenedesmus sp. NREL 46B-D3]
MGNQQPAAAAAAAAVAGAAVGGGAHKQPQVSGKGQGAKKQQQQQQQLFEVQGLQEWSGPVPKLSELPAQVQAALCPTSSSSSSSSAGPGQSFACISCLTADDLAALAAAEAELQRAGRFEPVYDVITAHSLSSRSAGPLPPDPADAAAGGAAPAADGSAAAGAMPAAAAAAAPPPPPPPGEEYLSQERSVWQKLYHTWLAMSTTGVGLRDLGLMKYYTTASKLAAGRQLQLTRQDYVMSAWLRVRRQLLQEAAECRQGAGAAGSSGGLGEGTARSASFDDSHSSRASKGGSSYSSTSTLVAAVEDRRPNGGDGGAAGLAPVWRAAAAAGVVGSVDSCTGSVGSGGAGAGLGLLGGKIAPKAHRMMSESAKPESIAKGFAGNWLSRRCLDVFTGVRAAAPAELLRKLLPSCPGLHLWLVRPPRSRQWVPVHLRAADKLRQGAGQYLHDDGSVGPSAEPWKHRVLLDLMCRGFAVQVRFRPAKARCGSLDADLRAKLACYDFPLNDKDNGGCRAIELPNGWPVNEYPIICGGMNELYEELFGPRRMLL